jgi:TolB-like protein
VIFSFGTFNLDTQRFLLRNGDDVVDIEPQVFSVLLYLIENRDRVVTKDEFIDHIWDGRAVSDGTLSTRINAARKAVGDDGKSQAVIKTFPRRGFRFITEVNEIGKSEQQFEVGRQETDKPSIAVLPFDNMSEEPDQDYFSDGLTQDIITALAAWNVFPVIGRNSTFTFKGQTATATEVSEKLGARYILEGSVRKVDERIRITAQLLDGKTGHHLWAHRYDRNLEDVFALQDEITRAIVVTLQPELERAALQQSVTKPPEDFDAWDYYLRGMSYINEMSREATPKAREMFERALVCDTGYARAAAYCSFTYHRELRMEAEVDHALNAEKCLEYAEAAINLDPSDYVCHWALALACNWTGDFARAVAEARITYSINPNWLESIRTMGSMLTGNGQLEEALPYLEEALRLNPLDPANRTHEMGIARNNFLIDNYEQAIEWGRKAIEVGVDYGAIDWIVISAYGHLGDADAARSALKELGLRNEIPETFAGEWFQLRPHYGEKIKEGLRKAGIPDS